MTSALSKWTRITPRGIFRHIILSLLVTFYYNWLNNFSQLLSSSSFPVGLGLNGSLEPGIVSMASSLFRQTTVLYLSY